MKLINDGAEFGDLSLCSIYKVDEVINLDVKIS